MMLAATSSPNASTESLTSKLAIALPQDVRITLHHLSSLPTPCAAIFSVPPGSKPEKTFCESHFVTVSVTPSLTEAAVFVYAIEILIYSTEYLTTLFVSKADSTGYSRLVEIPRGSPSLLKTVSSTLISHLVVTRQRPGIKLVVSLFGRAQDQYLFPGSIENSSKHVLDDRGLVRWWSGVLDSVLRQHVAAEEESTAANSNSNSEEKTRVEGYLIVPGCDKYETLSFLPPSSKADPPDRKKWSNSHPLRHLATNPNVPPRCLIPHFPDDPKARFLDELDDELPEQQASQNSPTKRNNNGQWKSVKTLEQFWELMAFRQECSSGRLVGFLWVVFTPPDLHPEAISHINGRSQLSTALEKYNEHNTLPTPSPSQQQPQQTPSVPSSPTSSRSPRPSTQPRQSRPRPKKRHRPLTGPIIPRQPRTKTLSSSSSTTKQHQTPPTTKHYYSPPTHRGQLVLSAKNYQRAIDLLLRLDFADRRVAENSTRRWVDEIRVIAGRAGGMGEWGEVVVGRKEVVEGSVGREESRTVDGSFVRRKRKSGDGGVGGGADGKAGVWTEIEVSRTSSEAPKGSSGVNVLSEGLVRKKKKLQP